jgi:hypothetical protein
MEGRDMADMRILTAAAALAMAIGLAPAQSAGLAGVKHLSAAPPAVLAQQSPSSRGFRRCMRAKYGPRYFARVPRAHRWHMSQACMA